jgi:hypothetical protein
MATATSPDKSTQRRHIGRKVGWGLIALLAIAMLWLISSFNDIVGTARLGTAYAAHIACSCRYIEGRPLDACYSDFEQGMGMISLTDDPSNKRVRASVPLIASAVAERRGDFGCLQLNDAEIEALE